MSRSEEQGISQVMSGEDYLSGYFDGFEYSYPLGYLTCLKNEPSRLSAPTQKYIASLEKWREVAEDAEELNRILKDRPAMKDSQEYIRALGHGRVDGYRAGFDMAVVRAHHNPETEDVDFEALDTWATLAGICLNVRRNTWLEIQRKLDPVAKEDTDV